MPVCPSDVMPSNSFLQDHSFHERGLEEIQIQQRIQEIQQKKQKLAWRHFDDEPGPSQPKRMCHSRERVTGSPEERSRGEGTDGSSSRHVRYVRDVEPGIRSVASNIVEEVRNAKAVVDKYFSKGCGQLSLISSGGKKTQSVLFHYNQAWAPPTKDRGHAPLLESHTHAECANMLKVGDSVNINARKITGCHIPLQATAVWVHKVKLQHSRMIG